MNADEKILFTQIEIQTHSLLLHSRYLLGKLNQKVEGQEKVFRSTVCVGVNVESPAEHSNEPIIC